MKTLYFDNKTSELVAIDQTKLPSRLEYLRISSPRELYSAIKCLAIRGAPAIGVGAALGLYAAACRFEDVTLDGFRYSFEKTARFIASARPTARNLFYACERMERASLEGGNIAEALDVLKNEAFAIESEDIAFCRAIGKYGEPLIPQNGTVLTHCNAGSLCAVEYGTALAPIYTASENGKSVKVYADETRPLLQGARLTCWELSRAGIDVTVICDNMAAGLMAAGKIDLVIVGCDRVAANGDFANKTGTLSLAVNANHFGVPFYVAAPSSTIDRSLKSGADIVIEQREGREITEMFYSERMAPADIGTYNPAFDVTPRSLVTAFITENGLITDEKI